MMALYLESAIRVQDIIVIDREDILFDFAGYHGELLPNLIRVVLAADDLEPVVLIVVHELGIILDSV